MNNFEVYGYVREFSQNEEGYPGQLSHGKWLSGDEVENAMFELIDDENVVWNPTAMSYDDDKVVHEPSYLMIVDDGTTKLDEPIALELKGLVSVGGYTGAKAIPRTIKKEIEISIKLDRRQYHKGEGKKPIIIPREHRRHAREVSAA